MAAVSARVRDIVDGYTEVESIEGLPLVYLKAFVGIYEECEARAWQSVLEDDTRDGVAVIDSKANPENKKYVQAEAAKSADEVADYAVLNALGYESPFELPHVKARMEGTVPEA